MFALVTKKATVNIKPGDAAHYVLHQVTIYESESEAIQELAAANVEFRLPRYINLLRPIKNGSVIT